MNDQANKPLVDNTVIPVMREAIVTVQMLLFKTLRQELLDRSKTLSAIHCTHLAGAVINNLFGTQASDAAILAFAAAHRELVEQELRELATRFPGLLPLLTDALRMQTICDNQEGVHSIASLLMAKALGILQENRPLPLPSTFMLQVRTLAAQNGLIMPMQTASASEASPV